MKQLFHNKNSGHIQSALQEYVDVLVQRHEHEIAKITLFGSYARGDAREDSDVDVLIQTDLPQEKVKILSPFWMEAVTLANDIDDKYRYTVDISPKLVSREYASRWSPLLANVDKEGILLWSRKEPLKR